VLKALISEALADHGPGRGREAACLAMLLLSASCVPLKAAEAPRQVADVKAAIAAAAPAPAAGLLPAPPPEPEPMVLQPVAPSEAFLINAAIPIVDAPNPRADSFVVRAAAGWDQARSLQCLAEAVYYEARSESEDGQRAVAQVVLNRVRHPAYPSSVCGVVYQGPLRAGGGCQFTFTCDGSLATPPAGAGWLRARRIAAAALAGSVYGPVGHATHYHTHQVVPAWAWKLAKLAVIGSHNFYRMQGDWGAPAAFSQRHSGREPAPAAIIAARLPVVAPRPTNSLAMPFAPLPVDRLPAAPRERVPEAAAADNLPQSQVRPEFANSGRWRDPATR
jgi:hypothetical protein